MQSHLLKRPYCKYTKKYKNIGIRRYSGLRAVFRAVRRVRRHIGSCAEADLSGTANYLEGRNRGFAQSSIGCSGELYRTRPSKPIAFSVHLEFKYRY